MSAPDVPALRCPDCGSELVERTNSVNGSTFLGCVGFPVCRHTQGVPAFVEMRRAGAAELPGLENEP